MKTKTKVQNSRSKSPKNFALLIILSFFLLNKECAGIFAGLLNKVKSVIPGLSSSSEASKQQKVALQKKLSNRVAKREFKLHQVEREQDQLMYDLKDRLLRTKEIVRDLRKQMNGKVKSLAMIYKLSVQEQFEKSNEENNVKIV